MNRTNFFISRFFPDEHRPQPMFGNGAAKPSPSGRASSFSHCKSGSALSRHTAESRSAFVNGGCRSTRRAVCGVFHFIRAGRCDQVNDCLRLCRSEAGVIWYRVATGAAFCHRRADQRGGCPQVPGHGPSNILRSAS